ncbi:MAG: hypothetical protein ACRCVI_02875 [Mycoplasmoidaceae bacterium]
MSNEVFISELKSFGPETKAIIAAISNVEILGSISNESPNRPIIFLLSKNKFFIFKNDTKEPMTEIYSFDKITKLEIITRTRRRAALVLTIDNNKKYFIEDIKKEKIASFIDLYHDLAKDFQKSDENIFLKNIDILSDYDDNDLLKNIINSENIKEEKVASNEVAPMKEKEKMQPYNPPQKSKRIVDDSKIADDTTFSSKYLYSLLSKKNTLLPDGKLSNIDKINSKIDELDISATKVVGTEVDKKFIQDIKNALLKINEKVNLLKENVEENVVRNTSATYSKIDEVAANAADSKEIMKMRYSLENTKNEIEKELKEFVKATNEKMTRISENLISDDVLKKIDERIEKSKAEIVKDIDAVKNSFREKMYFLNDVADRQIVITKELKRYSSSNENYNDEIYHIQKAWLENNKKFAAYDEKLSKLQDTWRGQTQAINGIIAKLRERTGSSDIDPTVENSSFNNEWFLDSIHNTSNKLLAVNDKGRGIYFDVEDFKKDIDKLIAQSENELLITVDEKIHEFKKFLLNTIEDLTNSQEEKILDQLAPKPSNLQTFVFKAKGYILNGKERYGIRSGQTLSLKMEKNIPGIDSMYYCEENKEPLYVKKYDGIIFANRKYYINTVKEFSTEKKDYFKLSHIEYQGGIKPYRLYEIIIDSNLIEYKVFDEKGFLITDNDPVSAKFDLKWLTFFKE